jgi:uroporphyrinogen decarboxylase
MTSQIGPDQFREFVRPHITPIFSAIREQKGLSSFFVCGHAQQNIEAMCECEPDNVSVDENIALDYVRDICLPRGVSFGGNLQLTSVLLLGDADDAQRNALECMEVAGAHGFILAPGCDLPFQTPPANLEAVGTIVRDEYQREVARAHVAEKRPDRLLDLKEYGHAEKVIVDIITLDSEACAPCQYMVESVKAVTPEFEGLVEWREHKIKYRESLVFMTSLMVRNVPTICIDGQIRFVSKIPPREELIKAIQDRINDKLRIRIRSRRATLFLLGPDSEEATKAEAAARTAIEELGADVAFVRETDEAKIRVHGYVPSQCPVFVLGRYQLKSSRQAPPADIIKEWIKDV